MARPPAPLRLHLALQALAAGGVIACPTEAVWGLSCDPWNRLAVRRLLALKGRAPAKGLILVAAAERQFDFLLADLDPLQRRTLAASWPGPNTWLVPHAGRVPLWIHGEHDKVALRVSDHPSVKALCAAWGGPLVSTSANPAGRSPPRQHFQVKRYFGEQLDYILPGTVGSSDRPTVIRDLASGRVIRP
ncbi:MAG: L-threonylcarbamoyladenylate synthase [Gammaproteobacteria bacterium]|jgi:L-threonylcarbamoyladenylate synthase|nr:L-threonylcarbamoyladenylate synthase [Gammaproteobacteria bacterium]MDH5170899.1 L-threonylcarbamoyladenylate synthase [Gammaproteobacteria bacterium]